MDPLEHLEVARKAHEFTLDVYAATAKFPKSELFSLTSQLRRSSVSIGSNIAEGDASGSDREFARYLNIALGSAAEADYQLRLSRDLGYVQEDEFSRLRSAIREVRRMLRGLLKAVRSGGRSRTGSQ